MLNNLNLARIIAPITLLVIFLSSAKIYSQEAETLNYADRKELEFMEDTINNVDIYLYGLTTEVLINGEEVLLAGVTITMRDLFGETVQIASDDSAFYALELNFDNVYLVYFEYEGMYTKYLAIDTRDVIDIEQEKGYFFPTDMTMVLASNFDIAALYLKKPVGKAYFDRRLQMIIWDLKHTDRLNAEIQKISTKKEKKK